MLHKDDKYIFCIYRIIALKTIKKYRLKVKRIEPKKHPYKKTKYVYGIYYPETELVTIAVRWKNPNTRKWHKRRMNNNDVLDTLAHELAHSRHIDHNKTHQKFTNQLYEYMVKEMKKIMTI